MSVATAANQSRDIQCRYQPLRLATMTNAIKPETDIFSRPAFMMIRFMVVVTLPRMLLSYSRHHTYLARARQSMRMPSTHTRSSGFATVD
jgi:hypothetical protein